MQSNTIYGCALVLVWMCMTQPACWARSKHQRELVTKLGIEGEKSMFHSASFMDALPMKTAWPRLRTTPYCSVKTKEGKCCKFPFLYKGIEQTECVKGKTGNWCGVTYNYDKEKKWGWCEDQDCSVKTKDGECCKFPFLYKGTEQTECVKGKTGNWCGLTYNYAEEKKWGWCEDQDCSVKTKDGECCKFPFLYKGTQQTECVKGKTGNWCGVTYNYDEEKKWGWCEDQDCSVKTKDGECCKFPFLYKGTEQTECVQGKTGNWCGVTYNYDKEKKWGWCEGSIEGSRPESSCMDLALPEICKMLYQTCSTDWATRVACARTCQVCGDGNGK